MAIEYFGNAAAELIIKRQIREGGELSHVGGGERI